MLLHDTWFVVGHFHYVLSLGSYRTVVIFLIWWWPVIVGCSLNKYLLQGHWLASMVGFNLCFFPMHYLGLFGLPRRVCRLDPAFFWINMVSTTGAFISVVRAFFLMFILWESLSVGNRVIGLWGRNTLVLNVVTIPTPYHSDYISEPNRWVFI